MRRCYRTGRPTVTSTSVQ